MTQPRSLVEQIEWFHRLAALPETELCAMAAGTERDRFIEFVRAQLPGIALPDMSETTAFAATVIALRANERKWNQALQRAVIEAVDIAGEGKPAEARRILLSFAAECP